MKASYLGAGHFQAVGETAVADAEAADGIVAVEVAACRAFAAEFLVPPVVHRVKGVYWSC